jgi:hypothetical protein
MDEEFEIPVFYKNQRLSFTARLLNYGTSYKIEVIIDKMRLLFEPDEERNWRGVIPYEEVGSTKNPDKDLIKAVGASLEELLK